jgi:hypothetical protein
MNPVVEDKLLSMKEKLNKIARQKSVGQKNAPSNLFSNGILDLSLVKTNNKEVTVRSAPLIDQGDFFCTCAFRETPLAPKM